MRSGNVIARNVLDGFEEIVSHRGTHQYGNQGISGISACGLAALNFARVTFEKRQAIRQDEAFLRAATVWDTVQVSLNSPIFYPFV
jgi:hypothetical protein